MGSLVRSRAKWTCEGEKPTSYFLNLENRNYVNKIVPKLIQEDCSEEINGQKEILLEMENYYRNLYQNKGELHNYDLNEILKTDSDIFKLSDIQRNTLEGEITYNEAIQVLKKISK